MRTFLKPLVCAAFIMGATCSNSYAVIVGLGPLADGDQVGYTATILGHTAGSPSFAEFWTFSVAQPSFVFISESDTVSRRSGETSSPITSGLLSLFSGTPGSGTLLDSSSILPLTSLAQSALIGGVNGDLLSAPGNYFFEVSGNFVNPSNISALVNGSISVSSAVPEPSTWAMMILGFAGVGFLAYRRKNKHSGMAFRVA
jgi:PEP-CTERM motif